MKIDWKQFEVEYQQIVDRLPNKSTVTLSDEKYEQMVELQQEFYDAVLKIYRGSRGLPSMSMLQGSDILETRKLYPEIDFAKICENVGRGYDLNGSFETCDKIDFRKISFEDLKKTTRENIKFFLSENVFFDDDFYIMHSYWQGQSRFADDDHTIAQIGNHEIYKIENYSEENSSQSNILSLYLSNQEFKLNRYNGIEDVNSDEENEVELYNGEILDNLDGKLLQRYESLIELFSNSNWFSDDISRVRLILKKAADEFHIEKYGICTDQFDSYRCPFKMRGRDGFLTDLPLRIAKLALFLGMKPEEILELAGMNNSEDTITLSDEHYDLSSYKGAVEKLGNEKSPTWRFNRSFYMKQRSREIYNRAKKI